MSRAFRFAVALVAGLGILTLAASFLVNATTRDWFEKDITLRSQLIINGVRRELLSHWRKADQRILHEQLTEITHDERIMAAAACDQEGKLLAKTDDFPAAVTCAATVSHARPEMAGDEWREWARIETSLAGAST